jgi:glucose/arabinose dehydrogenase
LGGVAFVAVAASAAALAAPAAPTLPPARALTVPPGYAAELYATGLARPTALAFGPDGLLYATQETGEVVAVGRGSTKPRVVARGFVTPLGLAWVGTTLYVSAQGSVSRLVVRGRTVVSRRTIVSGLPFDRHQQDTIALGPDGRLYLGSGTTCDVCREKDRRSGAILSFRPDGSDLEVVARGLRNPFGLVFHPDGRLFVSDNARDDLGDEEPAETVVVIRKGANYGWPGCWASWRLRKLQGRCAGVTPPFAYLEPHSSANTLALWRGGLVVAEWGQYLSERWGRKLVRIDLRTRRSTTLADGFEHPLGLAVARDGSLLAGDWGRGVVYRIRKV